MPVQLEARFQITDVASTGQRLLGALVAPFAALDLESWTKGIS